MNPKQHSPAMILKHPEKILTNAFSTLVNRQYVFIAVVTAVAVLKLILAAVEPVSYDMFAIVPLVINNKNPLTGPWIALYPPIYLGMLNLTQSALQQWYLASPANTNANFQLLSFLFRLPIFTFDVATAIALYYVGKMLATPIAGRLASLIWFLNPFALFSVELIGVPDVVATFLVVVTFGLLISRRTLFSGIFLALGVWVKLYPIFLLPPILLFAHMQGSSLRSKTAILGLGLIGLVGYLSWVLPFNLLYLVRYSPVTQPLPFISGETVVDASTFALIVFYCVLGLFAKKSESPSSMLVSTLLIYYLISNPYPQYLIWVMPLMALDLAVTKDRFKAVLFTIFYTLALTQWFFNSSAFLTPSRYSLLMIPFQGNLPWYSQAIANVIDWSQLKLISVLLLPLIYSGFYASAFIYAVDVTRSWFTTSKHNQ